jgi:hypothetical protein
MWGIYLDSKTWGQAPSQRLKVPPLRNDWAAWQFDGAVLWVGTTIENALQEHQTAGNDSQLRATLTQVLEPKFRLTANGQLPTGGLGKIMAVNPGIVGRWKAQ